jgi:hypothetical protein
MSGFRHIIITSSGLIFKRRSISLHLHMKSTPQRRCILSGEQWKWVRWSAKVVCNDHWCRLLEWLIERPLVGCTWSSKNTAESLGTDSTRSAVFPNIFNVCKYTNATITGNLELLFDKYHVIIITGQLTNWAINQLPLVVGAKYSTPLIAKPFLFGYFT